MTHSYLYLVTSKETVNFLEALAAASGTAVPPFAATAMNNLPISAPGMRRFLIRVIEITAIQNFGPEINIFSSAAGLTVDPDTDSYLSRFSFTSSMGEQIGGTGLWRYYIDGLAIPYFDLDTSSSPSQPTLHVVMQNIDTVAKLAGAPGAVDVNVWLEPMQAY